MSLFTEPVDRYFVGKLLFGLLFVGNLVRLLSIVLKALVPLDGAGDPWAEAALLHGLGCLLWFGAFRVVESRRRASGDLKAAPSR